jgi:hypothetical protein
MFMQVDRMLQTPQVSPVALAAGLPARYLYWFGHSGQRYLFTCTSGSAIGDFEAGVAMAVASGRIVWVGEAAALARMPRDASPRRAAIYVHLLAATRDERRAVIDDLQPEAVGRLRLAA